MAGGLDRLLAQGRQASEDAQRSLRAGLYRARLVGHGTLRRVSLTPSWIEEGQALPGALRVSPSVLDVVEEPGETLAVISEDGQPARPFVLGVVADEQRQPSARRSWLRALLHEESKRDHLELGALSGVRVKVGTNTGDVSPVADQVIMQAGAHEARLSTSGTWAVQNSSGELVAQLVSALGAAQQVVDGLALFVSAVTTAAAGPGASTPVTNGTLLGFLSGLDLATVTDAKAQLDAALTLLETFEE